MQQRLIRIATTLLGAMVLGSSNVSAQSTKSSVALTPKARAQIDSVRQAVARFATPDEFAALKDEALLK